MKKNKVNQWAHLAELDEPFERPTKERDYIDSFEENKNLIMALKKAADLGTDFEIPLTDGSTMVIGEEGALQLHDKLLLIEKPANREAFATEMGESVDNFVRGLRLLNALA